jgi:anti-anti-sigma factor
MNDLQGQRRTGHDGSDIHFSARTVSVDPGHVVEMAGELDLASRTAAILACTAPDMIDVVVDLSGLVFMDSAGYGALVGSTATLVGRGGSLRLSNAAGGPRRLLALIDDLDLGPGGPWREVTTAR